jgi:DNA-binding response OmpR family regulator
LLVSPETNFHRTLERILCRCGYSVRVVSNGEEALAELAAAHFDAVVSQVDLPGAVSGLALLERLRERALRVPVVMLSEGDTERLRRAFGAEGGATWLRKDVDIDLLKNTLAACLGAGASPAGSAEPPRPPLR